MTSVSDIIRSLPDRYHNNLQPLRTTASFANIAYQSESGWKPCGPIFAGKSNVPPNIEGISLYFCQQIMIERLKPYVKEYFFDTISRRFLRLAFWEHNVIDDWEHLRIYNENTQPRDIPVPESERWG